MNTRVRRSRGPWRPAAAVLGLERSRRRPVRGSGRARQLIGRDVEGRLPAISGRWKMGLLLGAVLALLAVVHVRVRTIDQGYQLAQAVERVDQLVVERQRLRARLGALRNRQRLAEHAERLGFARPEREISLGPPFPTRDVASAPGDRRMAP